MIGVNRKLARRSAAQVYDGGKARPIIVELAPPGQLIGFRLAKRRTTYHLQIAYCFREAVRLELARQKAERKARRRPHGPSRGTDGR